MLQRLSGVGMLLLQRLGMGFVLSHTGGQAGNALAELGDFRHPLREGLLGRSMDGPLLVQRGFGALQLVAQCDRFLPGLFQHVVALLQLRGKALLRFGDDCFGLLVQSGRQPANQVLQGLTDRDLGAEALPFFLFQLLEVTVDCGLGAGVAQRHPDRVH